MDKENLKPLVQSLFYEHQKSMSITHNYLYEGVPDNSKLLDATTPAGQLVVGIPFVQPNLRFDISKLAVFTTFSNCQTEK